MSAAQMGPSELDPVFRRQFGWSDDIVLIDQLSEDAVVKKFMASYIDDPNYRRPAIRPIERHLASPDLHSVRVWEYKPHRPDGSVLIWAHGGGFVAGDLEMQEADGFGREIASRSATSVITVDYRLSDGLTVHYPTPHNDVVSAIEWAARNYITVFVGGASAGASLALAAALQLRDHGRPLLGGIVLAYPLLTDETNDVASWSALETVPHALRLTEATVRDFFATYRGPEQNTPYATADGNSLAGLPHTLLFIAAYDDLAAQARDFARRAEAASVTVTALEVADMAHGFLNLTPSIASTEAAITAIASFTSVRPLQKIDTVIS